jgi:hypothetical protein
MRQSGAGDATGYRRGRSAGRGLGILADKAGDRMGRKKLIVLITAAIGLVLIEFPSSVRAEQPPRDGCAAVSKIEYDSAKRQYFLSNSVGIYVRTGRPFRRFYWYCH